MRTFSMRVFGVAYWVIAANFAYQLVVFIVPQLQSPEAAPFIPILMVLSVLILGVALAATLWSGAAHRAWFWIAGLAPALLLLLFSASYVPYALTHPGDVQGFAAALTLVSSVTVAIVAGLRAHRDVRRPPAAPGGGRRGGVFITAMLAAAAGALLTSLAAAGATGGGSIGETDRTALLEAAGTAFIETSLEMSSHERLALIVVNHDSYAHSFDIDSLDIHVQLPANSSTAIGIDPAGPGTLEYYCAIPGHTDAGMRGLLTVRS